MTLLRLARRVAMAMGIGRQTADTDESRGTATMQVALPGGELRSDLPHLQLYGFASRPQPGADAVVMFQSGDRSRGVVVASGDQRYRPADLAPGDACLYHFTGSRIWLKADGSILLAPANGQVSLTGTLNVSTDVVTAGKSFIAHQHGGVQAGSSNTGAPV